MTRTMALIFSLFAATQVWAQGEQFDTYKVDDTHFSVVFKASHLGYANVYGMFGSGEGTINWHKSKPEQSNFEISVNADSVNSMVKKRDDHLKGPDFFNVKQHPKITMKSKTIKKTGKDKYDVTADLTLLGVTKPVKMSFHHMKTAKDPWGKDRTGGEVKFKVKRTDFGMNYMSKPGEISDEIEVVVNIEAVK